MSMPTVLFTLFGVPVYIFGITVALGIGVALYITLREAKRLGMDPEKIFDLSLLLMVGGILGARVLYILLNLPAYLADPISMLSIHKGGLAFHGAVFAGALMAFLFARKHQLSFLALGDLVAPGLALGYAVGRLGCDIYGNVTSVAWAVDVYGVPRHPVQYYSAAAGFVILGILWARRKSRRYEGELLLLFTGLYSGYRFMIEFFRSESGGVTEAQLISLFILVCCMLGYGIKRYYVTISVERGL